MAGSIRVELRTVEGELLRSSELHANGAIERALISGALFDELDAFLSRSRWRKDEPALLSVYLPNGALMLTVLHPWLAGTTAYLRANVVYGGRRVLELGGLGHYTELARGEDSDGR